MRSDRPADANVRPVLEEYVGDHSQILNQVLPVPAEGELAAGDALLM